MSLLLLFNGPTTLPPPPANLTVFGFGHPAIFGLSGESRIGPPAPGDGYDTGGYDETAYDTGGNGTGRSTIQ
jgi:hypothetical protein